MPGPVAGRRVAANTKRHTHRGAKTRAGDHAHYGAHLNSHSNSARPAPTEVGRTCYLACVVQAVHMHVNCYNGAQSLLKQRGLGGGRTATLTGGSKRQTTTRETTKTAASTRAMHRRQSLGNVAFTTTSVAGGDSDSLDWWTSPITTSQPLLTQSQPSSPL